MRTKCYSRFLFLSFVLGYFTKLNFSPFIFEKSILVLIFYFYLQIGPCLAILLVLIFYNNYSLAQLSCCMITHNHEINGSLCRSFFKIFLMQLLIAYIIHYI